MNGIKLDDRSKELRKTIINTMEYGGRGHLGPAFSIVEILRVLYDDVLKYDVKNLKLKHSIPRIRGIEPIAFSEAVRHQLLEFLFRITGRSYPRPLNAMPFPFTSVY